MNFPWLELFRSVELVWALWLASLSGLALLAVAAGRLRAARPLRDLPPCQIGAAYTLGYVITLPLFALLVCLVVDMSLILTAKVGTVYAAFAAGRSAVVWMPSGAGPQAARNKARTAAAMAMTPFASGARAHQPTSGSAASFGPALVAAHRTFAAKPAGDDYLLRKARYAQWATEVQLAGGDRADRDLTVTIDYRAPFHLPGIGLLLGAKASAGGPRTWNIRTVVTLESHAPIGPNGDRTTPVDPTRPLGIRYVPAAN